MKAIVVTGSGPPEVLKLRDVEKPTPRDNEILVKVHDSTVTAGDVILRKMPRFITGPMMTLMGFKLKKIAGHEFAGVVEAVGRDVRSFREGDHAFGTTTGLKCGANAEYVCIPEDEGGWPGNRPTHPSGRLPPFPSGGWPPSRYLDRETSGGGTGSSSTGRPVPWAPMPCSWRSVTGPT